MQEVPPFGNDLAAVEVPPNSGGYGPSCMSARDDETTWSQRERNAYDRPSSRDAAKFAAGVALLAIFWDAAVGHGLAWENDPYWTYWVTKTFLIFTVFALGTAWLGIGIGRGAVITAVHTVVLTIYYWTFSPIGLPSSPDWLDLEHTWLTGLPIHFGVIYLGYLSTLWLWRRRPFVAGGTPPGRQLSLLSRDSSSSLSLGVSARSPSGSGRVCSTSSFAPY